MLAYTALSFQQVSAQSSMDAQLAVKARDTVQRLGVGHKSRVDVKLRDNTKLKGYISAADENSFTVTDSNTGSQVAATTVPLSPMNPGGPMSPPAVQTTAPSRGALVSLRLDMAAYFRRASAASAQ